MFEVLIVYLSGFQLDELKIYVRENIAVINPYTVLGVEKNASLIEIKRAFRRLAKETHPDLNGNDPMLVKRFHEVTEAYAILSDPKQKSIYDARESMGTSGSYETDTLTELRRHASVRSKVIEMYISQLYTQAAPFKAQAIEEALKGFLWLIGGALVSFFSYNNAAETGGKYVIFWGAIIFGGIQFIRAMINYFKIRKVLSDAENELWKSL